MAMNSSNQPKSVTRCLHWDDFLMSVEKQMLLPQQLLDSDVFKRDHILWFAPTIPMEDNNCYGNVSFVIDWKLLMDKMGPHLYFIDQHVFNNRSYARVLLSKKECPLDKFDFDATSQMGPLKLEVHIGVEVDETDAKWLFKHCSACVNNHALANTEAPYIYANNQGHEGYYQGYRCFMYKTVQQKTCPYPFSEAEILQRMQRFTTDLLRTMHNSQQIYWERCITKHTEIFLHQYMIIPQYYKTV